MAEPAPNSEMLGRISPERFRIDAVAGSGKHAEVLKAWDRVLRRNVALKMMLDPGVVERFDAEKLKSMNVDAALREMIAQLAALGGGYTPLREARLLAALDHPNVVPVLEIGVVDDGVKAVVMPYLDGGTLAERKLPAAWTEVLDIALEIGWGLAALHDAGLLHRDLKPNNILFDRSGRPRIADLGLACRTRDDPALAERVGTHAYKAPDVITYGFKDERDDLYAYCMIVYEMLNGRPPFASAADKERGRVSPSDRRLVPRKLHEILVRGLAPDAAARWPSVKALLRAMEKMRARAQRWRLCAATVAAAAGVVAAVMFFGDNEVKADPCSDVAAELAPIWDERVQAQLDAVFETQKVADGLADWADRWVKVRAQECEVVDGRRSGPTPCTAVARARFDATVHALTTPQLRAGLKVAALVAELPEPEHCLDSPEDAQWGHGGLLELRDIDMAVDAVARFGDLDEARSRVGDYMTLAIGVGSEYASARAIYFRGEIALREGRLEDAAQEFHIAHEHAAALGAQPFTAECVMRLAEVAGANGQLDAVDAYAVVAREMFERHQPDRVADLLQVQGRALVRGPPSGRERGVQLLLQAVEMRAAHVRKYGRNQELLSQAHESYAIGLLAVGRAAEAVEYLDKALRVHREEFGRGTWRERGLLKAKFSAMVALGQLEKADTLCVDVLNIHANAEDWATYVDDAFWLAEEYQRMGYFVEAIIPLRWGLEQAELEGLDDDVQRFKWKLDELQK